MVNLLLKDLRVARTYLWLIIAVFLLASLQSLPVDEAFFWLAVCLAAALVAVVPVVEWHLDADGLISSLPVRRSTIVAARHVAAALAGVVALAAWIGTGYLLTPLLDAARTTAPMWSTFDGVLTFITVVGGLTAIFLPLYFHFGVGRGAAAFGFVCLVLLAGAGAPMTAPAQLLRGMLSALGSAVGARWTLVLVMVGVATAFAGSTWVAGRGFDRRDL
jgi:hypothetical protein